MSLSKPEQGTVLYGGKEVEKSRVLQIENITENTTVKSQDDLSVSPSL